MKESNSNFLAPLGDRLKHWVEANSAQSKAPEVKYWKVLHGMTIADVMSDGSINNWTYAGRATLGVGVHRVSRAIRRLRELGVDAGKPKYAEFGHRTATAGDLVIFYSGYGRDTTVKFYQRPGSTDRYPRRKAALLLGALKADIGGSVPDVRGLG